MKEIIKQNKNFLITIICIITFFLTLTIMTNIGFFDKKSNSPNWDVVGIDETFTEEHSLSQIGVQTSSGEDDNESLQYSPYRFVIIGNEVLKDNGLPKEAIDTLPFCLEQYLKDKIPGDTHYLADVYPDSVEYYATVFEFDIYIPEYKNTKITCFYSLSDTMYFFKSDIEKLTSLEQTTSNAILFEKVE